MAAPASFAMGEELSVTTAIIGLLAVGGKTIDALWDLNTPANKANSIFATALQEIKQCRSTVHILYKTFCLLESAQLPFPERGTWIEADYLIATLTDTVLAVSDMQAICATLNLERQGLATLPAEDVGVDHNYSSTHDHNIHALCSRIRWHNLSMTMMMTILKCPGESDAQNSRVGLERRMTRLLAANTDLSGRMRQLEDVFDGQAIDRESLPHYSPPARQQAFWVPQRAAPSVSSTTTTSAVGGQTCGNQHTLRVLSPFSGYTLADIPVLSIIPLPVTTGELVDGNEFYTFAYARRLRGMRPEVEIHTNIEDIGNNEIRNIVGPFDPIHQAIYAYKTLYPPAQSNNASMENKQGINNHSNLTVIHG
ncbi:uncharacterized protein MAM_02560 [Metarhizium album ARSEF 1941]|uniref:Fungal N-terminal domain-containing protein n=1 Tax=Metarhizium album (strain ARSEF 1941) TaxID=1081103 RepID=A0A0B2X1W0_METAS|nr:uncharacterized protein MAM_02560 [Metarhizium album ARSEF 1941]KHN99707.1 hypothetical protein MAM_02560 [Metarhizium album ARSEF 1941]